MIAYDVRDLACLRAGRLVFEGVSFTLDPGEAVRITGPNGSGKSSLLRVLAGLLPPFAGRAGWREAVQSAASIAYVGHANGQKAALSAAEDLSFWAALADRREAAARARLALAAFGLGEVADLPQRYLSQGQKRRAALARLLAAPARLWLLDEPTVGLDREAVLRLEATIGRHRQTGGMVVATTHLDLALDGAATIDMARHRPADEP